MQIIAQNTVTMSSLEMAELTGKRHDSVKRTIGTLADKGVIELPQIVEVKNHLGQVVIEYQLAKRDSFVVVAQLCPEFTAALVDRWQELEAQVAQPQQLALPSYAEALRGLADQIEQTEQANALLAIAAPKAAFVDQYVEAAGSMSFRQVSKLICANERAFRQMLLDKNVMYYLGGVLTPYKPHQDAGRFEVKTGTSEHNGHAFSQARFTAKGVQWVAGVWAAYLLEVAA